MRPLLILALLGISCAHGPALPAIGKPRIDVLPFTLAPSAQITRCTDNDRALAGPVVASWTVDALRRRGWDAARPVDREANSPAPEFIVSGSIDHIDGGSAGWRRAKPWVAALICLPCFWLPGDRATVAVSGQVTRPDGTVVGRFHSRHSGAGSGATAGGGISAAAGRIGQVIAQAVDEGRYDGGAPGTVASSPTPPAAGAPSGKVPVERLEQLEALRARGLITDAEYQQKRAQILGEL